MLKDLEECDGVERCKWLSFKRFAKYAAPQRPCLRDHIFVRVDAFVVGAVGRKVPEATADIQHAVGRFEKGCSALELPLVGQVRDAFHQRGVERLVSRPACGESLKAIRLALQLDRATVKETPDVDADAVVGPDQICDLDDVARFHVRSTETNQPEDSGSRQTIHKSPGGQSASPGRLSGSIAPEMSDCASR